MEIELVKWNEKNKKDLIRICNNVDRKFLSNRLPYPYTEQSANWWYENVLPIDGKKGIFRAIKVGDKVVGNITVEPKQDVYEKDVELGYMLEASSCGKGIMKEAVKQICDLAFNTLDIERITAYVYSTNVASQKVLLYNGFLLEGVMRKAVFKDENIYDLHIYGKCKNE